MRDGATRSGWARFRLRQQPARTRSRVLADPVLRYRRAGPQDPPAGVAALLLVGSARRCWYCHAGLCGPAAAALGVRRAAGRWRRLLRRLPARCILPMPGVRGPVPPEGLVLRRRVPVLLPCLRALRLPAVGGPSGLDSLNASDDQRPLRHNVAAAGRSGGCPLATRSLQGAQQPPARHASHAGPGWLFELKYDGFRLLAAKDGDSVTLRYRSGRNATVFPEVAAALAALPA